MSISLPQKIVKFLKENSGKRYTAYEIAQALISDYPDEYNLKKENSGFTDEKLLWQVASEIGARKNTLLKLSISWDDFQKPRRYFYQEYPLDGNSETQVNIASSDGSTSQNINEFDLYQPLMTYLYSEIGLYCMRIRENTSKNSMGAGANKWLHPDIVAMQPLDKNWNKEVRECLKESGSSNVKLWSFEVKRSLTLANLRQSFFQAVSNSSWANEGYLVASIFGPNIESELRILSSLHGIGIIKLNIEDTSESEILLPSARRPEADWQSVNRIFQENNDFRNFIRNVYTYLKAGNLELKGWNQ